MARPKKPFSVNIPQALSSESPEVQQRGMTQHAANVILAHADVLMLRELATVRGGTMADIIRQAIQSTYEAEDRALGNRLSTEVVLKLRYEAEAESRRSQYHQAEK